MTPESFFNSKPYLAEKEEMPIIRAVIDRLAVERPFAGTRVAIGHFLALNSVTMFEAIWRGGADVVFCNTFQSEESTALADELHQNGITFLPLKDAVTAGDYFIDNAGMLGKERPPKGAVEVTRTGESVYESVACPTISIDNSRLKYLEDYMGTGESCVRGWYYFRPDDPLEGKRVALFGYGKVGRGVAHYTRLEGVALTVIDVDSRAVEKAQHEGFQAVSLDDRVGVETALREADIIVGATGIPGVLGTSVPNEWLRANTPFLVNIGIDEFGPAFRDDEIVGGREAPINYHLHRPTKNHFIDPILAAQMLAFEDLILHPESYSNGVHPLPASIDEWVLKQWIALWPDEDLSGIEEELGLHRLT